MTKDEALKMAIDNLELCNGAQTVEDIIIYTNEAIQACKEALEQPPPKVEPFDVWAGTKPQEDVPIVFPRWDNGEPVEVRYPKQPAQVTRVEIIDIDGRSYVNWKVTQLELQYQDNGKTLKLFMDGKHEEPTMTYEDGFAHGYEAHRVETKLEQPAQKPVAWMNDKTPSGVFARHKEGADNFGCDIPLYTHPAPLQNEFAKTKSWQGLSDDEIEEELKKMWDKGLIPSYSIVAFARAIEAKLKEKNHG